MPRRLLLVTLLSAAVAGLLLVIAAASPSAADTPLQTSVAKYTQLAGTVAAAATRVAGTATALKATALSLQGSATAFKGTITPNATATFAEASQALTEYASRVLGISVTVTKAGGLTLNITRTLTQIPQSSTAQSAVLKLATRTYGGLLKNGAAGLSYGQGTITGDVKIDVQGASLGVYSLSVATNSTAPLSADTALALAKTTFPNLARFTYTPYSVSKGFAWYAKGSASGYDLKTKKVITLAEAVILYVAPGTSGKAVVTATVGRGDFATSVKAP